MNVSVPAVLVLCGVLIAIILILFLPAPRFRRKTDTPGDYHPTFTGYRDDDQYWSGFIYNNPDDPAVFVPKRFGLGWTINFGRPLGKFILIGSLLLPLVLLILSVLLTGGAPNGCHPSGCHPLP